MKHLSLMLCLILVFGSAVAQKKEKKDKRLEGLDEELSTVLETWNAAGFAVAIVEKDKVVYSKGFGMRNVEEQLPVTENTLFAIGSSTKAFTSALLGQLREETDLDFDESPIKYIPELRFYNDELNNGVTIQDMMCHRTGIPRHDVSWYLFPAKDRAELIERMAYQEPFTGLRKSWYYNNFMFLTQGVIAERITGKDWKDNIDERFFTPLGMTNSNCTIDEMVAFEDHATGYSNDDEEELVKEDYYRIEAAAMGPAGSINSNVKEMSEWLKLWINGGMYGEEQILTNGYVREAMTPHMAMGGVPSAELPSLHMSAYGYGWFLSSYKGRYRVEHGGNIDGFSANVAFYPTDSIGVVVLVNQNGSDVPSIVRNIVADRMMDLDKTDWNALLRERFEEGRAVQEEVSSSGEDGRQANTRPSHNLVEYTGNYSNPGYGNADLILRNDSLILITADGDLWLSHYHYDVFMPFETKGGVDTTDKSPLLFNFSSGAGGDISGFHLPVEPTIEPIFFERTPLAVEVEEGVLEQYVGEYELAGQVVKVYIKDESTLYVFVPGQPEYELLPTGEDKFAIKILNGYNVAFVKEGESVTSLKFIQPNGTFVAKKK
ncbi:MAG: serine hydrolase [Bacteroidota bacterium]